MKHPFFLFLLFHLLSLHVQSQWRLGLKAGTTASFVSERMADPYEVSLPKYGVQFGVTIDKPLNHSSQRSGISSAQISCTRNFRMVTKFDYPFQHLHQSNNCPNSLDQRK